MDIKNGSHANSWYRTDRSNSFDTFEKFKTGVFDAHTCCGIVYSFGLRYAVSYKNHGRTEQNGVKRRYKQFIYEDCYKVIGISYLVCITAELCKDAGENAIAAKIELGGKLIILAMAIPIINSLLNLVKEIIMHK